MNRTKLTMLGLAAALPLAGGVLASAAGPNLIFHGDFTTNMNGWVKMGGQQHSVQNGRLKLVNDYTGNGNSYYGVRQCVDGIDDKAKYTITGDLWVDKGQSLNGSAGIYLHFNTGANCNGSNLGGGHVSDGHTEARRGEWLQLKHSVEAPDGAKSVMVRLISAKELAGSDPDDFVAYFDNIVMNEAKPIIILPTPTPDPTPDLPVANPTENPDPTPDLPVANPTENPDPTPDLPVANPTENPDPTPDLPVANPTADSGGDADPGAGEESPAEEPVTQEQPQPGTTEQPSQGGETPGASNGGSEDAPAPGAPQTGTGTAGASRVDPVIFGSVAAIFGGIGVVLAVLFRRSQQQPKR